jgi:light-regulated signal transduction histidine kinase (bacteriophytochrome)
MPGIAHTSIPTMEQLLQGCESELLHLSGAIQSFGAMLRIDTSTNLVTHVSANVADYIGKPVQSVLGCHVDDIGCLSSAMFSSLPLQPGKSLILHRVADTSQTQVDALLIRGESSIIVELEKNETAAELIPVHEFHRSLLNSPFSEDELREHHGVLLNAFRSITGYDRVMIYRFQEDWSGEVVAEATSPALGSYLGLHFPASDIPEIARKLYMLNPSRMIPDTSAEPVPVLSLDASPPDLTWSDLRSVSPVHLEYLSNMAVGASFSVPIRMSGRLWGLVACHHLQPRLLTPDQRSSCVALTNAYSLALTSYFSSHRLRVIDSLDRRIDKLLEAITQFADPLDGIETNSQSLMDALSAKGFAMCINDDVVIAGDGPDPDGMAVIDGWFLNECKDAVFVSNHLEKWFSEWPEILSIASGMIAIKALSPRSGWVRFYWFRPAAPYEVTWAGNPNKPVVENAGVTRLSPRRSFEKWIEIKTGYSRPWSNEEKMVSAKFRNTLLRWL